MTTDTRRAELRRAFDDFAHSRDRAVRDRLVEEHLGIAVHLARRFSGRGEALDDLVQVASLALVGAVERFDPGRGVEFSTFATRTILGELKRHFRDRGWFVRAPRRVQELYLQVGEAAAALNQELGRSPTIDEIAARVGAREDDVIEALEAGQAYRAGSLDAVGPDGETLHARIGHDDLGFGHAEDRVALAPALALLPRRERTIVELRFVDGLIQLQIAERMGISQMHVSRLLAKSLQAMRDVCAPASA
ncbi:MAG TPA: SigB/SigF/SigG family RNA polymerase sigma factor [Acidimicrobiales bacterium]|nr:SigB/SigF/SigG family RNA polymerase sigma factor [Acidimicrobiales bacterium]